jgi:hypothetical protein
LRDKTEEGFEQSIGLVFDLMNYCPNVYLKEMGFSINWQEDELWQLKFKTNTD